MAAASAARMRFDEASTALSIGSGAPAGLERVMR